MYNVVSVEDPRFDKWSTALSFYLHLYTEVDCFADKRLTMFFCPYWLFRDNRQNFKLAII